MAVLAIYPHASTLHVQVSAHQLSETTTFPLRLSDQDLVDLIQNWLGHMKIATSSLKFAVTNGHLPPGCPSGLYALSRGFLQPHLNNRGPRIGQLVKEMWKTPVYIIDPSSLLECDPLARVTGTPEINRGCRCDSFIFKHLVRLEEEDRGIPRASGNFIVAHLDEEIHIGVISQDQMIDGGISVEEGPFAWQQAGALPFDGLLDLCLEAQDRKATLRRVGEESGLQGYLGLKQFQDLYTVSGEHATLVFQALIHQVSKEIGAYATVLKGQAQGILLAGELVKHESFVSDLIANIKFLGTVSLYPGNQGLSALKQGIQRVLSNEPIIDLKLEESDAYGVC